MGFLNLPLVTVGSTTPIDTDKVSGRLIQFLVVLVLREVTVTPGGLAEFDAKAGFAIETFDAVRTLALKIFARAVVLMFVAMTTMLLSIVGVTGC
jgi:hypothetical protein